MVATAAPERIAPDVRPQDGPQEMFLSCPADIAIIGGSVYGGKTWSLVMEPVRHAAVPGFTFAMFRHTVPEIRNPGGLWDETRKWYPALGASPREGTLEWRQICLLEFDQLEEFTESQFF